MKRLFTLIVLSALSFSAFAQTHMPLDVLRLNFKHIVPAAYSVAEPVMGHNYARYDFFSRGECRVTSNVYNADYLRTYKRKYIIALENSLRSGYGIEQACANLFNTMKNLFEKKCYGSELDFSRCLRSGINRVVLHRRSMGAYVGYSALFFSDDMSILFYVSDNDNKGYADSYIYSHIMSIDTFDPFDRYDPVNYPNNIYRPRPEGNHGYVPPMPAPQPAPKPQPTPKPQPQPAPAPKPQPQPAPAPKPQTEDQKPNQKTDSTPARPTGPRSDRNSTSGSAQTTETPKAEQQSQRPQRTESNTHSTRTPRNSK